MSHDPFISSAILDAIPSQIALLDDAGVIVAVNEAWRRFGAENAIDLANLSVGQSYLAVCDRSHGNDAESARQVAVGIRAVIAGDQSEYSFEYPCHSPSVQRWYRLVACPISYGGVRGTVVMHTEITARHLADEALKLSELQHRSLFEKHPQPMWIVDRRTESILAVNDAAVSRYGYSREEFLGLKIGSIQPLEGGSAIPESREGMLGDSAVVRRHRSRDGQLHSAEVSSHPVYFRGRESILVQAVDVTERLRAEHSLYASNQQLNLILASMNEGVFGLDAEGRLVFQNSAAGAICGYSAEEIAGQDAHSLVHHCRLDHAHSASESNLLASCPIQQTLVDGKPRTVDFDEWLRKDGAAFPVEYTCAPQHNEDGAITGAVVTFRDISASVRTAAAMSERTALLESAQEVADMGSWVTDVATNHITWSPSTYKLLGVAPGTFSGTIDEFHALVLEEDRPKVIENIQAADAGSGVIELDYRIRRPDGSIRWLHSHGKVEFDLEHQPIRRLGMVVDVTERKRTEQIVQLSEARYRGISDNSPDVIFINRNDRITYMNAAGLHLLRASSLNEILGKSPLDLFHPDFHELIRQRVAKLTSEPTVLPSIQERLVALDGTEVDVEVIASSYAVEDGIDIQVCCRDIRERLRSEREREELLNREKAARLRADSASSYYRALFEYAPGSYVVLEPEEFRIVAVSQAFLDNTSVQREQIMGCRMFEAFPEEADESADGTSGRLRESLARVKEQRQTDVMPVRRFSVPRHPASGGGFEERFWSVLNSPVPGPDGEVAYIIHRVEDVTEFIREKESQGQGGDAWGLLETRTQQMEADVILRAKELEQLNQRLRDREGFLKMATESAKLGAWELYLPSMEIKWSSELRAILDLPEDYVPTLENRREFYTPESYEVARLHFLNCLKQGVPFDVELQAITATGRRKWTRMIGEAVRNRDGEIVVVRGAFQDIDEQKRRAEELQRKEALLNIAGKVARLGGWALRIWERRVLFSPEIGAVLGWPEGVTPTYRQVRRQFSRESWRTVTTAIKACVLLGWSIDVELPAVALDGSLRELRCVGELMFSEDGRAETAQGALQDITEVNAAKRREQELASRLTNTLDNIQEAFFIIDREWRFSYLNLAAEQLMRRSRGALLGDKIWTAFPDAQDSGFGHGYRRAMEMHEPVEFEEYYLPLGAWFAVRAFPIEEGIAVYFVDITKKHEERERLRLSEERFRLLSMSTADSVYDWDMVSNQMWWQDGSRSVFSAQVDTGQMTIDAWAERIHPDDRERIDASLIQGIQSGGSFWSDEYRFRLDDGGFAYVVDRGHILRDHEGRAVRMVGGMSNLTERKEAEIRLAEQAALIDQASDAILVRDLENNVTYWSKGAEKLYGWRSAEVLGRPVAQIMSASEVELELATQIVMEHGFWTGELVHRQKTGESVPVLCRWNLLRDAHGNPRSILAIDTDLTDRKRLEKQLLRAQRLESIGVLAGGIAHDFNNILAPILMSIEVLKESIHDEAALQVLGRLHTGAERGADLVKQILAFARGRENEQKVFSPALIAKDIERIVRDTFPRNIEFRLVSSGDGWNIEGSAIQVHQVLLNLCVNARDAMPDGGRLQITLSNIVVDKLYSSINPGSSPGSYVMICVEDTGTGMSREVQERIFEPFFTTKEYGKGTGLGLSMAFSIVRDHRGFINFYSEPGEGTRFKLYFPAAIGALEVEDPEARRNQLPRGRGELVLLVDDEESIREVTRQALEQFGYRVLTARQGAEAVSLFVQYRGEISVVVTDMNMPVMDGPALISAIRRLDPEIPIIGSSGLVADGSMSKAVDAGVTEFIAKPHSVSALLAMLQRVVVGSHLEMGIDLEEEAPTEIPAVVAAVSEASAEIRSEPALATEVPAKPLVLVVDDQEAIAGMVSHILTGAGFDVATAHSGQQALELLKSMDTRPGLILTDLYMSGMTGAELAAEVQRLYGDIAVVFMSGDPANFAALSEEQRERHRVIAKPFAMKHLIETVRGATGLSGE